jgi:hypothetical protein
MHDDINRFILLVLIFVLSMVFLIIRPNIIRILLGWDGLGLVSYCLVIYYQNMLPGQGYTTPQEAVNDEYGTNMGWRLAWENWRNSKVNLLLCHFFHYESHISHLGLNLQLYDQKVASNFLRYGTPCNTCITYINLLMTYLNGSLPAPTVEFKWLSFLHLLWCTSTKNMHSLAKP